MKLELAITGYNGFLGRHLTSALLAAGHSLHLVGRSQPLRHWNTSKVRHTFLDLSLPGSFEHFQWPLCDGIFHLAAAGVKASSRDWDSCFQVNFLGLHRLLEILTRSQVKPWLVLASSFYEIGSIDDPELLNDPYIATKYAATQLARSWSMNYQATVAFARIFQVYGSDDDKRSVLCYIRDRLTQGQPAKLGSGLLMRDWIHVDRAIQLLFKNLPSGSPGSNPVDFDVGSGRLESLQTIAHEIARQLGRSNSLLDFDPSRPQIGARLKLAARNLPPGWMSQSNLETEISAFLCK